MLLKVGATKWVAQRSKTDNGIETRIFIMFGIGRFGGEIVPRLHISG
jgi:hypothetical protein